MSFHFELVSPEKLVFSGDIDSVVLNGSEGEMTVFAQHAPVMTALRPGLLTMVAQGGKSTQLFVAGGFADITATSVTVLADKVGSVEDAATAFSQSAMAGH